MSKVVQLRASTPKKRPSNFWRWVIVLLFPVVVVGALYYSEHPEELTTSAPFVALAEFTDPGDGLTLEWDRYPTEEQAQQHCEFPVLITTPSGDHDEFGCPRQG